MVVVDWTDVAGHVMAKIKTACCLALLVAAPRTTQQMGVLRQFNGRCGSIPEMQPDCRDQPSAAAPSGTRGAIRG